MLNLALELCVLVQVQVFLGLLVMLTREALYRYLRKKTYIGRRLTS
jgi:hypothetical protein